MGKRWYRVGVQRYEVGGMGGYGIRGGGERVGTQHDKVGMRCYEDGVEGQQSRDAGVAKPRRSGVGSDCGAVRLECRATRESAAAAEPRL